MVRSVLSIDQSTKYYREMYECHLENILIKEHMSNNLMYASY